MPIKGKSKQTWPEILVELLHKFSGVIVAVGVLLIAIGILVFLGGPSGPMTIIMINGHKIPIYDFTRPFLGLDVATTGLAIIVLTCFVGNPLLGGLGRMRYAIERSVSGMDKPEDPQDARNSAKLFFVAFGVLLGLCFLFMAIIWSGLPPFPYILQPIIFDTVVRFALFAFLFSALTMVAFFLIAECLGSVLFGLRLRVTRRLITPTTLKLDNLHVHYLYRELGSRSSFISYMIIGFLAYLAFTSLELLREPLLIGAFSLWAFAFAKCIFTSFQKACHEMGLKPESAFKSEKLRGFLGMGVSIWNGVLFFLVWRLLFLLTLKPAAVILSRGAVINGIAVSPFADAMVGLADLASNYLSQVVNDYLIYIIFLLVTIFAIYLYVLPEYFMRKSKRAFLRKVTLAVVVFSISLISQLIISYFAPSSPSLVYSSLIFIMMAMVIALMQKSYEDAVAGLS
jgi:hypothetical protein